MKKDEDVKKDDDSDAEGNDERGDDDEESLLREVRFKLETLFSAHLYRGWLEPFFVRAIFLS